VMHTPTDGLTSSATVATLNNIITGNLPVMAQNKILSPQEH